MATDSRRLGYWSIVLVLGLVCPAMGQQGGDSDHGVMPQSDLIVRAGPQGGHALSMGSGAPFHRTSSDVINHRLIAVPDTSVRLALWEEVSATGKATPFYAISLDGQSMATVRSTSYAIKLRHEQFDPADHLPVIRTSLASADDMNVYIVQFVTQPLPEYRNAIGALGGTVYRFLSSHAHLVKMSPAVRDQVAALPYVRWVGPYEPAYRMEGILRDNAERLGELFPLKRYNIQVFEAGSDQKNAVADRIEAMNGKVDRRDAGKRLLEATLTPEQLHQVARWDEVAFIDRWSPYEKDMNNAREYGGANHIETVAGYTGQGVRGEVFDTGFNTDHVDFASRPLLIHGTAGSDSHGAATSGICFGDGTGDLTARGLLPDGQGIVSNYSGIMGTATRYTHTGELLQDPYYGVFQTSSVGSDRTFFYTTISADTDEALFDFDVVHCQSQSNAGNQDSRPQAWAKNIISGGGVYHYDTLTIGDDCWCSGGSIGPAQDGRIKPDLCAYYDDTRTTTTGSSTAYTSTFGGTSGATPIIAGHVGLFSQMWADGIFGNEVLDPGTGPTGYDVFDNRAHMTTVKAVMINTAQQYAFSGQSHDLTRVHQGWGWPDLAYLYDMRDNISIIDESEIITNLETLEFVAFVESAEPAMRVTMVFADPPGLPAAAEARINDLTLKVISPSEVVYWGNNGLLDGNWSVAGGSANTVDTVENVFILNPESGLWTIEIIASEIVEDGHVETPELDADFALVVSGAQVATCSSEGRVHLDRVKYPCDGTANIRVSDCDLNTDELVIETVTVTVESDTESSGETVLLTETGENTADFRGSISLDVVDAPGMLHVTAGDTVTVTYIDADNGLGGYGVTVTDIAVVDCVAPVITNVQVTDIGPLDAVVTFDTDEPTLGSVRYGGGCGSLTQLATQSGFGTAHSVVLTGLTQDSTFYFAVDAEDEGGNLTTDDNGGVCYSFATPTVPDACGNATIGCPGVYNDTTTGMTNDGSSTCGDSDTTPDIWYSYTPGSDGQATFSMCSGTSYDAVMSVHSGCPGTTTNELACSDDDCGTTGGPPIITLDVSAGNTYLIRATGFSGATGSFTLQIAGPECGAEELSVTLPAGPPDLLAPGVETPFSVSIEDGTEAYVPGSGMLHYRYDGGAFQAVPLVHDSGTLYVATLPAAACADSPEFYISAQGDLGTAVYLPSDAPAGFYSALVGESTILFADNFETDQGWTVQNTSVDDGPWERGVPSGSGGGRGDPPSDFDGSGSCYITGNGLDQDLDGGPTLLLSPVLNLSAGEDYAVSYARWLRSYNGTVDQMVVEISNNDGGSWITVETVPNGFGWTEYSFNVGDYVVPTALVRVRFTVSDNPNDSVTEGGIDAFIVSTFSCEESCIADGDMDGSGLTNGNDIQLFVDGLLGTLSWEIECHGDFAAPFGTLDVDDIDGMVSKLLSGS